MSLGCVLQGGQWDVKWNLTLTLSIQITSKTDDLILSISWFKFRFDLRVTFSFEGVAGLPFP